MSPTKVASICVGEAMRMYEGDQRVLPPASLSAALSISVTLIGNAACARRFSGSERSRKSCRPLADDDQIAG